MFILIHCMDQILWLFMPVCADTVYVSIYIFPVYFVSSHDRPYETAALTMFSYVCPEFHPVLQEKLFIDSSQAFCW